MHLSLSDRAMACSLQKVWLCLALRGIARSDSERVTGKSGACGLRRGSGRRADALVSFLHSGL